MSHFSFTRSKYDQCALDQKNNESKGPGEWNTDSNVFPHKEACYIGASPFMHNPHNSIPKETIDIESELKGLPRNLSKCSECKYHPKMQYQLPANIPECRDQRLAPEYTRERGACTLAGITINRFHPLCDDIQENIHQNSYAGANTRLAVKDAYEKTVLKPFEKKSHDFTFDLKTGCEDCVYLLYK